jgi:mono/diheme cytochrome c family protein
MKVAMSLAGALLLTTGAVSCADDNYKSLPPGPGREVMVQACSQCHSPELAAGQDLDPDGWSDLVNQMASRGAKMTRADMDVITKYLSTAFPAH